MTPEQIKEAVENYSQFLTKREQLEKRMISVSGKDPEQEAVLFDRLEHISGLLEVIHESIDCQSPLKTRESGAILMRTDGLTLVEMSDIFGLTRQGVKNILNSAYEKMVLLADELEVS
jgi:DNA-directed RNA polymerase sigma subunit (sigma70/sigma32)